MENPIDEAALEAATNAVRDTEIVGRRSDPCYVARAAILAYLAAMSEQKAKKEARDPNDGYGDF